ncbi:hypothetical protein QQ045_032222 [Rhodiola kirilowii]
MRIGNTFTNMMTSSSYRADTYYSPPSFDSSPSPSYTPRSPWHSPVPYLFGGLAAMLGLIAFALLVLACSYWKLSGYLEAGENGGEDQGENGLEIVKVESSGKVFEEKFLVIMAGEMKPTHLATQVTSRTSSFGSARSSDKAEEGGQDQADPGR